MKVLFLTNNEITQPLIDWLKNEAKEKVVKYQGKLGLSYVKHQKPGIVISYNYRYIIAEDIINFMKSKIINLHISLLPWNRGADPNFWSFLDNTPKGVTIHLIDKGVDTGDILLQKEISFNENTETLGCSYERLHAEMQKLFIDNWEDIKSFKTTPRKQPEGGSLHYQKNSVDIKAFLGDQIWSIPVYELKEKLKANNIIRNEH